MAVKRVVKRTVVRPGTPREAPPTVRYGRPVATAARPKAKVSPSRPTVDPAETLKPARQRVALSARIGTAGHRIGDAWWTVADSVRSGSGAVGRVAAARARSIAGWRLPHLNHYVAAIITGVITGLMAVGLGAASLQLFSAIRGVSTGGGLWGGITFIAIGGLSAWVGGLLLTGFGSPTARLTSLLGVVVTVVAVLALFVDQAQTSAAVLLFPALAATSYVLAHWLITLAEDG